MPNRRRPRIPITAEEFVATLQRSFLPTIVVEGDQDIIVYRQLERIFADIGVSVMPVGGRDMVLGLFKRSREFDEGPKKAFIADRDAWVSHGVPAHYQHHRLLLTDGYSIENDVLRDLRLENLMTAPEHERYRAELATYLRWYALAFIRRTHGTHPNRLLDNAAYLHDQMTLRPQEEYPNYVYFEICQDYLRVVRGKSLLAILVRHLSYSGRTPRHNATALLEMAAITRGPLLEGLFDRVGHEIRP